MRLSVANTLALLPAIAGAWLADATLLAGDERLGPRNAGTTVLEFELAPCPNPNSVAALDIDAAMFTGATFDPYLLKVRAVDGPGPGKVLPHRIEPRLDTIAEPVTGGRLVFLVPRAGVSKVSITCEGPAPEPRDATPTALIGDGDMLPLAGAGRRPLFAPSCRPVVADLDQDGLLDLLGAGGYGEGDPVTWFRNIGTKERALFSQHERFDLRTASGPAIRNPHGAWNISVAYADWDGDDLMDLIVGHEPHICWYQNVATEERPQFAEKKELLTVKGLSMQLAAADWDGDDDVDVLYGVWPGGVYLAEHVGSGSRAALRPGIPLHAGSKAIDLAMSQPSVADWDGDGDLDLMCGQYYAAPGSPGPGNRQGDVFGIYYFENVGTRRQPRLAAGKQVRDAQEQVPSGFDCAPTMVDWNSDRRMDLLVSNSAGIKLYLNRGSKVSPRLAIAKLDEVGYEPLAGSDFASVNVIDVDRDGTLDLVVADAEGRVLFFQGLADLRFGPAVPIKSQGTPIDEYGETDEGERQRGYTKVVFGDLTGDGRPDMVMWSMNGEQGWLNGWNEKSHSLKFYPGQRDPLDFGPPQEIKAGGRQIVAGWRCRPDLVDLDGDGLLDLVQTTGTGKHEADNFTIMFFRNEGDREKWQFAAGRPLTLVGGEPLLSEVNEGRRMCVRFADWDGDGDLDLFTARDKQFYPHFGIRYWENVGTKHKPVFADFQTLAHLNERVDSWHEVTVDVADIDRDGGLDLVVGSGDLGTVHFFRHDFVQTGYRAVRLP